MQRCGPFVNIGIAHAAGSRREGEPVRLAQVREDMARPEKEGPKAAEGRMATTAPAGTPRGFDSCF